MTGRGGEVPDTRDVEPATALIEPHVFIENRTFDEIEVGQSATLARTLTREDIELFAVMSGDVNPAHVDEQYAHSDTFHKIIAHGMWGASLISTLLGTKLPGPGTIYLEQTLRFRRPVTIADTITVSVTAAAKDPERHRISFDCACVNQDLAIVAGVHTPKVAILSAVETVNPQLRSSLEAAALAKMAERSQIRGGVVDGPLAFDDAVSPAASRVKGIASPVAGQADIVVVPDLESGSMLVKQLDYLGDSQAVGIVLGARVPIALTSRADSALERVASCALALLVARTAQAQKPTQDEDPLATYPGAGDRRSRSGAYPAS
jgi:acyl dehydratase